MLKVDCGENALLSGFHFEFSEGGAGDPNVASKRNCCTKNGGL
jgi:hypothetical protein